MGTPVGPGKDTHGTLGPDQREGRGWPEHSSTQQYKSRNTANILSFFLSFFELFFEFFLSFFGVEVFFGRGFSGSFFFG